MKTVNVDSYCCLVHNWPKIVSEMDRMKAVAAVHMHTVTCSGRIEGQLTAEG
jgi:hypothetical protein